MSIEVAGDRDIRGSGFPELTVLGKRIEVLRIERGLSKQQLARRAGTSRQQLWRVVTGKSELTTSLCVRLAEALDTDSRVLRATEASLGNMRFYTADALHDPASRPAIEHFLATPDGARSILSALPVGLVGTLLARELFRALDSAARTAQLAIPPEILALFRDASA